MRVDGFGGLIGLHLGREKLPCRPHDFPCFLKAPASVCLLPFVAYEFVALFAEVRGAEGAAARRGVWGDGSLRCCGVLLGQQT